MSEKTCIAQVVFAFRQQKTAFRDLDWCKRIRRSIRGKQHRVNERNIVPVQPYRKVECCFYS
jgi:hypothetical protein